MSLDLSQAKAAADYGIARVQQSAENTHKGWTDKAIDFLVLFARSNFTFMAEDVRVFAEENGLPTPPDKRAWGAAIRKARKLGLIEMIGYGPQRSVNCHGAPKAIWRGSLVREAL